MNKEKITFSFAGFFIGCFFFLLYFLGIHLFIGNPFGSLLSLLVIAYLALCTWSFSHILFVLDEAEELGIPAVIIKVIILGAYLPAPLFYTWILYISD